MLHAFKLIISIRISTWLSKMGSVLPLEVVTGWFYDCILLHLREVGDVANDICAICFHNTSYNEFVNLDYISSFPP